MSKNKNGRYFPPIKPPVNTPLPQHPVEDTLPTKPVGNVPVIGIREHRRCPSCWGVNKGKGIGQWSRPISGKQVKTCYQCDQCGYNWTVVLETVRRIIQIADRKVQVEHDEPPELETR